ncbi:ATP-binding cassette domain-containing protein [Cohaesibacter celericrescens]|uniref:ATP-binding cassette domain-containing protein n=1 Tax=Cohaesibacter celericrescens TaxID=2067669 RepID=UPI003567C3A0
MSDAELALKQTAHLDHPILEMRSIDKSFGSVKALQQVSIDCRAGEVHAICGENGAGKSTLMKVLGGAYHADSGDVLLDSVPVHFKHPKQAHAAGIAFIHQELSLLPFRSVTANIFFGNEIVKGGLLDHKQMRAKSVELLDRIGANIDPDAEVSTLSVAEQQLVEIVKALSLDARILVMDEPTAALEDGDALRLLDLVRTLSSRGMAILYISHRMPEIMAIAQRITVLKDGESVWTRTASEVSIGDIVFGMVGRELSAFFPPRPEIANAPPLFQINKLSNDTLKNISLYVRPGEILGVAGLEDSGKSVLARTIFGDYPATSGTMQLNGAPCKIGSIRDAIQLGIGYVPPHRKAEGLVLRQSVRDNLLLSLRSIAGSFANPFKGKQKPVEADRILKELDVRAGDYGQDIAQLSGGNQQKVIVGRWLQQDPSLIVFVEPTRGVDVAAKRAIYDLMRDFTSKGNAVIVISSDLPEVVGVSDRILVMRSGTISGELPAGSSEEDVMLLAVEQEDTRIAGKDQESEKRHAKSKTWVLPVSTSIAGFAILLYVLAAMGSGAGSAFTFDAIVGVLHRMVALGFVALGQTFTILLGSIDLSVANLISLTAVMASFLMQGDTGNIAMAVVACFAIAAVVGLVNGILVAYFEINPFIATLGTGLILQGMLASSFEYLRGSVPAEFQALAYSGFGGVTFSLMALFLFALIGWFVLERTRFGAHVYACGGNPEGARLAGIATKKMLMSVHVIASMSAAVTGLYLAARLRSGTPWLGQEGIYDLESIAVVVIGGTILAGGKGGVWGTLAGVFLFACLDASFNMFGVDAFLKQVLRGVIVIAAVSIYAVRNRGHIA